MTFAVIKTGGKQYKVAANDVVKIEKLEAEAGDVVTFDQVLMVGEGDNVTIGAPLVEGALVAGHFVATEKQDTVLIIKKHRRQHYDRRNGHRQRLSTVRITEILTGGAKPTTQPDEKLKAKAAAKAAPVASVSSAPKNVAKPAPAADAEVSAKASKPAKGEPVDDLKMIGGVGPVIEKKLHAAGVTSLTQVAAWTEEDIAKFDEVLAFHGRIVREDWVGQAKDLLAGKPPRAKADQDAAVAADKAGKKNAPKADKE